MAVWLGKRFKPKWDPHKTNNNKLSRPGRKFAHVVDRRKGARQSHRTLFANASNSALISPARADFAGTLAASQLNPHLTLDVDDWFGYEVPLPHLSFS